MSNESSCAAKELFPSIKIKEKREEDVIINVIPAKCKMFLDQPRNLNR